MFFTSQKYFRTCSFYNMKLDSSRCLDFFTDTYLETLTKVPLSILGHSQNFTNTIWIVGPLGQAITMTNFVV